MRRTAQQINLWGKKNWEKSFPEKKKNTFRDTEGGKK